MAKFEQSCDNEVIFDKNCSKIFEKYTSNYKEQKEILDLIENIIVILNIIFDIDNNKIDVNVLIKYTICEASGIEVFDKYNYYVNDLLGLILTDDIYYLPFESKIKELCTLYLCDGIDGLNSIYEVIGFSSLFSDFLIASINNQDLFKKYNLRLEDLIENFKFKDINWNTVKKSKNYDEIDNDDKKIYTKNDYAQEEITKLLEFYKKNGNYVF